MLRIKPRHDFLRHLRVLGIIASLLSFLCISPSAADEAPPDPIHAVSANGIFTLDITMFGANFPTTSTFTVRQGRTVLHSGEISFPGRAGFISDAGDYFVLIEQYDGIAIYDYQGKSIRQFKPDDLLSTRELYQRPDRWPCGPEGRWSLEHPTVTFLPEGKSIAVQTHSGRQIEIDLATGRITSAQADIPQTALTLVAVALLVSGVWSIQKLRRRLSQIQA